MHGIGTNEPFIQQDVQEAADALGRSPSTVQWRKPLSVSEVGQMAPTEEVRQRPGRP